MNRRTLFALGAVPFIARNGTLNALAATPTPQPTAQLGPATGGVQIMLTGTLDELTALTAYANRKGEELDEFVAAAAFRAAHVRR